jgi:hypothetical protein
MLAQLFELAVGHVFFDPQMTADPLKKLDHLCRLPLCEKIDLQIEMAALIGLRAHPVLTDQHEGREQHRFERQDHRQERERKRIKNREPPYEPAIAPIHAATQAIWTMMKAFVPANCPMASDKRPVRETRSSCSASSRMIVSMLSS